MMTSVEIGSLIGYHTDFAILSVWYNEFHVTWLSAALFIAAI